MTHKHKWICLASLNLPSGIFDGKIIEVMICEDCGKSKTMELK